MSDLSPLIITLGSCHKRERRHDDCLRARKDLKVSRSEIANAAGIGEGNRGYESDELPEEGNEREHFFLSLSLSLSRSPRIFAATTLFTLYLFCGAAPVRSGVNYTFVVRCT